VPSLELRRHYTDLFWCYKIVFGLVNVRSDDFFVLRPCTVTRGHKYKLYKHCNTARVRANFFTECVINIWNSLPDSVDFNSYCSFRRTVKRVKFTDLIY